LPAAACLTCAETVLIPVLALSISQALSELGYAGLVLLMIAETVFPPIPSEVVLPLAGYLVQKGDFEFLPALVASTFGSLVGADLRAARARHRRLSADTRAAQARGGVTVSARRPRILDGMSQRVRSQPAGHTQTVRT
jgi:hypothetical protein